MKNNAVLITIAGLAILVIGILGIITFNTGPTSTEQVALSETEMNSEEATSEISTDAALVSALPESYSIDIASENNGEFDLFATFEVESDTRSRSVIFSDGEPIELIIYDDKFYTFVPEDGWFEFENDEFAQANYIGGFVLDEETIAQIEEESDFKGEEACGELTCLVYESQIDGDDAQIKIDKDSNRIIEVTGSDPDLGNTVITYSYDEDIAITLPENPVFVPNEEGEEE